MNDDRTDLIYADEWLVEHNPAYWPSLDYPDREVWLKIRAERNKPRPTRVLYSGKKPLVLGINKIKRAIRQRPNKDKRGLDLHKDLIHHRHSYYRNSDNE